MSGGVDSSVSAALLKEQGYDVIGAYILGWTGNDKFPCNWQKEEADARAVAEKLDIPFYTFNLSKEYEKSVIDEFFAVYQAGGTPNPDVLCNREIKFKALWQAVRQFEPDFIATGHYAMIIDGKIYKGADSNKDQSYFLWGIDRSMLGNILFPIGDLEKSKVRMLAKKYGLPTANKKDSQGICFVGPLKVRQFIASRISSQPGGVFLTDGRKIADHNGLAFYTIGQRLGAGSVSWIGDIPPLFVIAKDLKNNLLIVGSDEQVYASNFTAIKPNWLTDNTEKIVSLAKIRYRQEDVAVKIQEHEDGSLSVECQQPVRAITPGQSVVFYSENGQLLGGAFIASSEMNNKIIEEVNGEINQNERRVEKTQPSS